MTDAPQTPDIDDPGPPRSPDAAPAPLWAATAGAPAAAAAGAPAAGTPDDGGPPRAPAVDPGPPWVAAAAPTQQMPTEQLPTQQLPTQHQSGQDLQTQQLPGQQVPTQQLPTQQLPTEQVPTQQLPGQHVPTQQLPGQQQSGQDLQTQQLPGQQQPTQEVPGQQQQGQELPTQQQSGQQQGQQPDQEWVPGDPGPQPVQPSPDGVDDGPPAGLWRKMRADPEYAPEHLAIEAVTRIGPKMVQELAKLRAQNPGAPADALAKMVVYRYTNHARLSGAVSGAVGLAGAVLDVGVLAWTQAKMVLLIAVIYGRDPADPERATELLVLQGVHKYTDTARAALQVARGRQGIETLLPDKRRPMNQMLLALGMKLAQMAGVKAAKRLFAKLVPGAAIILGSFANAGATKSLAKKAMELYARPVLPAQRPPMQLPSGDPKGR